MPPDVQALLAADSALLRSRWRLDTKLAPGLAKKAKEGGVPKPVVVIGGEAYPENTQRPKLLCAQATDWGDRLGTFDGFGYQGPFPIATLLSDACWSILEGRPSGEGNGDQNCAQMVPIIRRVLEAAQEGVAD
jgi:hypothetical protein